MRREAILWSCVALMIFGSLSRADAQRPYLGVSLDATPLPPLVVKHLRLEAGQGIRISNVMVGSPADKAGLDRDDIILAFETVTVTEREPFGAAVRQAGTGTQVTLEILHLGERKTLPLTLEAAPEPKAIAWKYPPEPEAVIAWRPGRVFKVEPDGGDMTEVPLDKIPDFNIDVKQFLQESYTYRHTTDGEDYTITIQGDPADEDSRVVVSDGGEEFSTPLGDLDSLPEKYRGPARNAVADARANATKDLRLRPSRWSEALGPEARRNFFQSLPRPDLGRLAEQRELALEKLQEQMERLQQQVKELEERNREMFDRLLRRKDPKKDRSTDPKTSAAPEP